MCNNFGLLSFSSNILLSLTVWSIFKYFLIAYTGSFPWNRELCQQSLLHGRNWYGAWYVCHLFLLSLRPEWIGRSSSGRVPWCFFQIIFSVQKPSRLKIHFSIFPIFCSEPILINKLETCGQFPWSSGISHNLWNLLKNS